MTSIRQPGPLANPKSQGKARRQLELREEQEAADLRAMLEVPGARRVVWRLLEHAGFIELSFNPASRRRTDFREGQRSVAHWLVAQIHRDYPEAWVEMQQEQMNAAIREIRARRIAEEARKKDERGDGAEGEQTDE